MANILSYKNAQGQTLFPPELTNELFNLVRGKSSLAKLASARPIPFRGETVWTFTLDNEVNVIGENDAKTNGGATLGQKTINPVKIEYGYRMSQEFLWASEEVKLQHLQAFAEGFANKVARGFDIMAMHGLNPRTGTAATNLIGDNHFDHDVTQTVNASDDGNANVNAAIALVEGNEFDVTGMAMSPLFRSVLVAQKKGTTSNESLFPELAWGANPSTINGLPVDVNSTVNFNSNADRAIVGNFRDYFRWGYAREIPIEIIEYGNPDNDATLGDLKGHNQIFIRGEASIGWGILMPTAFSRIIEA